MTDEKTEKSEAKVSKNVEKLVDEVSKLSVIELSELVNALQDKLGVTAVVPVTAAPASAPSSSGEAQPAGGEQVSSGAATQTVVMTASGGNKIAVIKALREINQNLGLKEAKDATEAVPYEVLKDAKAEDAKVATDKLKTAGATVELK
ncbi:hypothetical protein A2865_03990 [Candidatus Woesebacteria bacterium RIFCSPHIGHO2_01_FULL_39_17]|uniref:Large ribosomal subunit protein bL12 n=2 Tax=Candidatus Woeseibacteriota TaxID=1752722 RepID=A0A0G0LN42_9BACT|nr:MAG: 50S ribosomal protein L7/L12 [Candidatus Woesebacteria bacterium GW2011_GWB1_39_10b]OGM23259.1 MAG: hypothetical protein A2865_03990 [Candidatus Woesebacteria bacterium RIFCSPHIGHO2_01_FULL_39_17]OGM62301.1 MAG: hypothetical protein A3A52_00730 [Candidatus Woesebacteria bacterium RIFCSPLOWO2_01_FULL_39_14]